MRDIHELEIYNFSIEGIQPPTVGVIQKFESYFHVTLPATYLDLLRQANGGGPSINVFQMTSKSGAVGVSNLSTLFHLVEDEKDDYGVWYMTHFLRNLIRDEDFDVLLNPDNLVAIGENGSAAIIFLDLSSGKEDVSIFYREGGGSVLHIAGTFEEFIDGLRETDEEFIY